MSHQVNIRRNGFKVLLQRGHDRVMAVCRNAPLAQLVATEADFLLNVEPRADLQSILTKAMDHTEWAVHAQAARRFGSAFA